MADVYISLGRLETMADQLDEIITEFEKISDRSEAMQDAIGHPYQRYELQNKTADFEGRWDLEREELKDGLIDVRDHLNAVIEGVEEWDAETALSLTKDD